MEQQANRAMQVVLQMKKLDIQTLQTFQG